MADIGKAIYKEITEDTELSNLLDNGEGGFHLYPVAIPEEVYPEKAIIYSDITTSNTYPNAETSSYEFLCVADTYKNSRELANEIKRLFNDKRNNNLGGIKTVTYTKFDIMNSFYDDKGKKFITAIEIFIKY